MSTWPAKQAEWRSAHSEARMQDVRRSSATPTDAALNAAVGCGGRAKTFEPAEVRYIKLGENGKRRAAGRARSQFCSDPHRQLPDDDLHHQARRLSAAPHPRRN